MVHLLLEDYASKRNKILKDPKFLELYNNYTHGIFGGAATLSKETFIDNIAKSFDPTYNVTTNAQTGALNGDSRYLDFIMTNLYSGNVTPDQAPAAREALDVYRVQTARNNAEVSKDLQSFKVFYPDENVKDRQGEPLPGLIAAMDAYITRRYDFEQATHPNLQKTLAAFQENNADEVYANSMYKFFRVDSADAAKILMGSRDPKKDPDFFTSGRSERCSGYWCLPHMPNYFPCWVAVDVYGFMDYAIVPKPSHNYSAAEIKNRFNHSNTAYTMSPASYEAILDFFLNHSNDEPIIANAFKLSFDRIRGGTPAFYNYGVKWPTGHYPYDDYVRFLVRMPDLESVSKLTDVQVPSSITFATKLCGIKTNKMINEADYQAQVGIGLMTLRNYYPGKKIASFAPLFKSLVSMHESSLVGTDFSYEKYAAQYIPSLIDSFKQSFPQDTDLLDNDAQGFNKLIKFISESLPVVYAYRPELGKKIASQIAKLVEEERLYFDATINVDVLQGVAIGVKALMGTINNSDRRFDEYKSAAEAINDSFSYYMSMGGAFNWKDPKGIIVISPHILDTFATYIENSTPENKQKLFDLYAQSITNRLTADARGEVNVSAITGLFDIAAKLNLPRETGIKKIVTSLDDSITRKPSSVVTRSISAIMNNDEISAYVNRNKKFINKVAPHFAQLMAIIDPSSDFGKMYPKIAKIKLSQKYVIADKRRSFFNELKAQSNNELSANRPELAFGNNDLLRNSFGKSLMVPASMENIQKMISLRGNGYDSADFQQMLPNIAMLINAGFRPQLLFINFGDRDIANAQAEMRSKGFKLGGRTMIKGELNGTPVAINGSGLMYYLDGNTLRSTSSFAELQQHQQQALFDHYKPKPKHGFFGLYERVATSSNK